MRGTITLGGNQLPILHIILMISKPKYEWKNYYGKSSLQFPGGSFKQSSNWGMGYQSRVRLFLLNASSAFSIWKAGNAMVHSYCPSLHVLLSPMITFSHRGIAGKPVSGQDERQLVSGDAGHRAARVDARERCEVGIQNPVVTGVSIEVHNLGCNSIRKFHSNLNVG